MVPVQFQVEDAGFALVGNLDALDNVLFLLEIGADDLAQLAQEYSLNAVEFCCFEQLLIVGMDDNAMGVKPAEPLWCVSVL